MILRLDYGLFFRAPVQFVIRLSFQDSTQYCSLRDEQRRKVRQYELVELNRSSIIIIFVNCNWVVTRWQWLFYMCTKYEIGY